MLLRLLTAAALVTGALAVPQAAQAAPSACDSVAGNLVANCGFETGSFTGWTRGGNLGATGVTGSGFVHSGSFGAALGPVGSDGTLSQSFATTIGDTYQLTYFHFYPGGTPNDFSVTLAGQTFDATVNATGPTSYTQYTDTVIATSTLTTLTFTFRNDPSYQGLDDVVVTDIGLVTSVPEPASMALLGVGLAALGLTRRRSSNPG